MSTIEPKVVHRFRSSLIRVLGLACLSIALFSIAGGHYAVFQTIAWAQMLKDYSKEASVAEAVEKTFSGEAPCPMCKKISEERQKEEKAPATVKVEKKGETFVATARKDLPLPQAIGFSYCFPADIIFPRLAFPPADPVPIGNA